MFSAMTAEGIVSYEAACRHYEDAMADFLRRYKRLPPPVKAPVSKTPAASPAVKRMDTDANLPSTSGGTNAPLQNGVDNDGPFVIIQKNKRRVFVSAPASKRKTEVIEEKTAKKQANSFAPLADLDEASASSSTKQAPPPCPRGNRPPPIIAHGMDVKAFNTAIKAISPSPKFFIRVRGEKCTIRPASEADHHAIRQVILALNVQGHTFPLKSERKTSLVLKGVHHSYEPMDVLEEIRKEMPNFEVEKVSYLRTPSKKPTNAFVITFTKWYEAKEIAKVQRLLNSVISWDRLRKDGLSICRNCCDYDHAEIGCMKAFRCGKCLEPHPKGMCKRISPEIGTPGCVQCGMTGHTVYYKGCPKYKQVLKQKLASKAATLKQKEFAKQSASRRYETTFSYADAAKSSSKTSGKKESLIPIPNPSSRASPKTQPKQPAPPKPTPSSQNRQNKKPDISSEKKNLDASAFCTSEANRLFGCDLSALITKVNKFLPKYKKLASVEQQQEAYIQFVFALCLGK